MTDFLRRKHHEEKRSYDGLNLFNSRSQLEVLALLTSGRARSGFELVRGTWRDDLFELTHLDPQVDTWILPKTTLVKWKGWNGDDVEGVLR